CGKREAKANDPEPLASTRYLQFAPFAHQHEAKKQGTADHHTKFNQRRRRNTSIKEDARDVAIHRKQKRGHYHQQVTTKAIGSARCRFRLFPPSPPNPRLTSASRKRFHDITLS